MTADHHLIAIEFGGDVLLLTDGEVVAARARAEELGLARRRATNTVEPLVTAEQLAVITGLPQSWVEEASRQNKIPSITAGRYRRFRASDVIRSLAEQGDRRDHTTNSRPQRRRA